MDRTWMEVAVKFHQDDTAWIAGRVGERDRDTGKRKRRSKEK